MIPFFKRAAASGSGETPANSSEAGATKTDSTAKPSPNDQAGPLRDLVRTAGSEGDGKENGLPTVVVAGSKGGVGTTTITAALAVAFQEQGLRPLAVDANLRQADLGQLLGTPHPIEHDIADFLTGRCTAGETIVTTPAGIKTMPGARAPATQPEATLDSATRLAVELAGLSDVADLLLIDAGAGFSPTAAPLWSQAESVLLITTAGELSPVGAYAAIKLAKSAGATSPVSLLANRTRDDAEQRLILSRVQETCRKFLGISIPQAGRIDEERVAVHATLLAQRLTRTLSLAPRPDLIAA